MWPEETPLEVTGRQGAIPLLSLDGVCPCRMCSILIGVSDLALYLMLRTAGHGIQKGSIARRVAIRLGDIGFRRSARFLVEKYGRRRGRGPGHCSVPELDFKTPGASSCVSAVGNGGKFYSPEGSADVVDYVPTAGIGSPAFHVGDR